MCYLGYIGTMKAKFGMVVVAGSGKIGGHVASRNRGGAYFRTKVTPINPQTTAQSVVRARLTGLASTWRSLSDAQRAAWQAAITNYATTDIFGDIKNPSGFNLYMKLNSNLESVNLGAISTPLMPEAPDTVSITSVIPDASSQLMPMVMSAALGSGTAVKVFATPQVSAGKTFVKNEFRVIQVLAPSAATPVALGAAYIAKFGALVEGNKIFVKLVFVDILTGQQVAGPQFSTVVVA